MNLPRMPALPPREERVKGLGYLGRHYLANLRRAWKWRGLARVQVVAVVGFCPFCLDGYFIATGTSGRLACNTCGSIALDGRAKQAVKLGG